MLICSEERKPAGWDVNVLLTFHPLQLPEGKPAIVKKKKKKCKEQTSSVQGISVFVVVQQAICKETDKTGHQFNHELCYLRRVDGFSHC